MGTIFPCNRFMNQKIAQQTTTVPAHKLRTCPASFFNNHCRTYSGLVIIARKYSLIYLKPKTSMQSESRQL
ncbi:hypothetical protein BGI40_04050 [Snodgrassella communis]|nr:hypothetical protein BGI29_01360 [Snodgrassella communis]PIT35042.1 hypothetical protein BGI40_04050 [Snodgrassella communis]